MSRKRDEWAYGGGIGFPGGLTITFIVLKLTDHIDWSWWWVLSPIWITWLVIFFILGIYLMVTAWIKSR